MVARNVFSASRRAPTVRFVPPGDESPAALASRDLMAGGAMLGAPLPPPMSDSSTGADVAPRLYGIVSQDDVRRALLLLTDSGESPRLYAVGDRQHGYRILSITSDQVVLATSTGSRTLRLVPRARRDSLENLP